jgi:hypothetical protein
MPRRGGQTSAVRNMSPGRRHEVRWIAARVRREQCAARGTRRGWGHEARGVEGRARRNARGQVGLSRPAGRMLGREHYRFFT